MKTRKRATKLVAEFLGLKKKTAHEYHGWLIDETAKVLADGFHPDLELVTRSGNFPISSVSRGDRLDYSGSDQNRAVTKIAAFLGVPEADVFHHHCRLVEAVTGALAQSADVKLISYSEAHSSTKIYLIETVPAA